jgi:hypothetical protein
LEASSRITLVKKRTFFIPFGIEEKKTVLVCLFELSYTADGSAGGAGSAGVKMPSNGPE